MFIFLLMFDVYFWKGLGDFYMYYKFMFMLYFFVYVLWESCIFFLVNKNLLFYFSVLLVGVILLSIV